MHMIDMTNARANIAYVGEAPWHKLGAAMQPGQPIDAWAKAAGLGHEVKRAPIEFQAEARDGTTESKLWAQRHVLYRSDTLAPLATASADYNIVQPATVLGFFDKLCKHNSFQLETAGALDGGRRIWALARVSDGAPVIGQDVVRPYVLLATSYDGSMSTTAKLTSVRVVCHNTLSYSVGSHGVSGEKDAENKSGQTTVVRVPHSAEFDEDVVLLDLGIALTGFDKFLIEARQLAKLKINDTFATEFLKQLLPAPTVAKDSKAKPKPIEEGRAFKAIMGLFKGEGLGAGLPSATGTAWGLLNACTQYVDHDRGHNDATRMNSAWFGSGAGLKDKARDLLLEVCK